MTVSDTAFARHNINVTREVAENREKMLVDGKWIYMKELLNE